VDAAAHAGALNAGAATVAVCGTGPDRVYPASHRDLAARIAAQGAIVTEFPPGTGPRRRHFPRRNRLISGLSAGVIVVAAGTRSGALITARLAAGQGREVFAVPGPIKDPCTRGCHRLLRDGATLVETPADVVAELGSLLGHCAQSVEQNTGIPAGTPLATRKPREEAVLKLMGREPASVDQLARWSGLTAAELCSMLTQLELAGYVVSLAGGRFQRRGEGRHDERNRA
jgi:DNA processing protein